MADSYKSDVFDNSNLSFDTSSNDIKYLMRAHGIYDRKDPDNWWYNKFARIGVIDPYNTLTGSREYIFITRPDLCLFNTSEKAQTTLWSLLQKYPFFYDAANRYPEMMRQLQSSASLYPFMNVLSNSVSSSLDIPGISSESIDSAANTMGTKISYRTTSYKSDQDLNFNLEFIDTKNLDIYMLFKIYDEYEKLKWDGRLDFTSEEFCLKWQNYTFRKVLHDQMSIYKIVVAEDGYRIVYWARITGCYPESIPRDSFSDMSNTDGVQKLTIGWKGQFIRDMDPIILYQFNQIINLSRNGETTYSRLPLFNTDYHSFNSTPASYPYIKANIDASGRKEYYLDWMI